MSNICHSFGPDTMPYDLGLAIPCKCDASCGENRRHVFGSPGCQFEVKTSEGQKFPVLIVVKTNHQAQYLQRLFDKKDVIFIGAGAGLAGLRVRAIINTVRIDDFYTATQREYFSNWCLETLPLKVVPAPNESSSSSMIFNV